MPRYLVISDSHGHMAEVLARCQDWGRFDGVIGAGDFYRDGAALAQIMNLPYFGAQGNNDREPDAPWMTDIPGTVLGLVIHGHQWPAPVRQNGLVQRAKQSGAEYVVFGHSHRRFDLTVDGIRLLNPGAIYRSLAFPPSVGVLDIEQTGQLSWNWKSLREHS